MRCLALHSNAQNWRYCALKSSYGIFLARYYQQNIAIFLVVFNETIIPLVIVAYEMIILSHIERKRRAIRLIVFGISRNLQWLIPNPWIWLGLISLNIR